jgi:hypothetical protein
MGVALVQSLVGEQLTAITFVMDYLQLCFDDVILSCFTLPTVQVDNDTFANGQLGWRDALCSCIGQPVTQASLADDALGLSFGYIRVAISLLDADYCGPEAFSLSVPSGTTLVV